MPLESYLSTGANEDITKIETVWSTLPSVNGLLIPSNKASQWVKMTKHLVQGFYNGVVYKMVFLGKAETNSLELFECQ
jgi:hypothetical protein